MSEDFLKLLDLPVPVVDIRTKLAAAVQSVAAMSSVKSKPVDQLLQAKSYSDKKRYDHKNAILRQLIMANPADFIVDSTGPYPGLTHVPTGFRIHSTQDVASLVNKQAEWEAIPLEDRLEIEAAQLASWEISKPVYKTADAASVLVEVV